MENMNIVVKGNIMTITVDLTKDLGKSASGKTTVIATSRGNQAIPGATNGAIIGLNVYRK